VQTCIGRFTGKKQYEQNVLGGIEKLQVRNPIPKNGQKRNSIRVEVGITQLQGVRKNHRRLVHLQDFISKSGFICNLFDFFFSLFDLLECLNEIRFYMMSGEWGSKEVTLKGFNSLCRERILSSFALHLNHSLLFRSSEQIK